MRDDPEATDGLGGAHDPDDGSVGSVRRSARSLSND
jgi:hypothetical protein